MKWKGEKVSGKTFTKNLLLPCLCMRREEGEQSGFFFFFKKRKRNLEEPKNRL
jgi:hypothetical protein